MLCHYGAGTYLPFEGSETGEDCTPCPTDPIGTFSAKVGTERCTPCPVGTYTDTEVGFWVQVEFGSVEPMT